MTLRLRFLYSRHEQEQEQEQRAILPSFLLQPLFIPFLHSLLNTLPSISIRSITKLSSTSRLSFLRFQPPLYSCKDLSFFFLPIYKDKQFFNRLITNSLDSTTIYRILSLVFC